MSSSAAIKPPAVAVLDRVSREAKAKQLPYLFELYLHLLTKKPLTTKCITGAILNALSDLLAQYLIHRAKTKGLTQNGAAANELPKFTANQKSLLRQFLLGGLARAPVLHGWFNLVDLVFSRITKKGQPEWQTAIGKVMFEQLVFAPFFTTYNFLVMGITEGKPVGEILSVLEERFLGIWKNNVMVWSVVGFLQYRYVPPKLRVFVGNLVSVFWNAYVISQANARQTPTTKQPDTHTEPPRASSHVAPYQSTAGEAQTPTHIPPHNPLYPVSPSAPPMHSNAAATH